MRDRPLGTVSDATARRLLQDYLPLVRRLRAVLFPGLPDAEAEAAGTDAILEAYLSLEPARASEATWVRRVVYWRLAESAGRQPWDRRADGDPELVLNGKNPGEAFERASAVAALAGLPVRWQMVMDGIMRGESFTVIGASLGISKQRAARIAKQARALLRSRLDPEEP